MSRRTLIHRRSTFWYPSLLTLLNGSVLTNMPHPTARSFIPAITLLAALLGIASLLDFKETRQQQSLAFSRRNYDHLTNLRQLSSSSVPKTDEEQHAHIVHKIFPKWPHAFPCHQNTVAPSNKNELGLLLTKLPKCASSTMAGINMRIADKFAKENNYLSDDASSTCLESSSHKKGANFKNRHPKKIVSMECHSRSYESHG